MKPYCKTALLEEIMRLVRDRADWNPTQLKEIDKLERAIAKILHG